MARTNACAELTKFWLQARHGCLVDESIPVAVPRALSDIDIVGIKSDLTRFVLPNGTIVGPRVIVESKDEHDWDPTGREFGQLLRRDIEALEGPCIPSAVTGVKFTMLRQQHFEAAIQYFGTEDFDRLFVVHALDPLVHAELAPLMEERRIYWITIPQLVRDLLDWYAEHPRPAGLRYSAVGDMVHLLVGYCGLTLPERDADAG